MKSSYKTALIVGAGDGLSASIARTFAGAGGMRIALAARNTSKLTALAKELNAGALGCDAAVPAEVARMFAQADEYFGAAPDVVVYNPSFRVRGSIVDIDPEAVAKAIAITAYGGFLVAQQAAQRMVKRGSGAILFTGASASVKGYPLSASFAMGKFALRGLAQSIARELAPKGVHVAHFVIDGGISGPRHPASADAPDAMLDPDAIAANYLHVLAQERSAWTWELELRPWVEKF
ncbi:MAG: SDR family NAD(P)-dependent oxidoreductase [Burkholderiales bacterium]